MALVASDLKDPALADPPSAPGAHHVPPDSRQQQMDVPPAPPSAPASAAAAASASASAAAVASAGLGCPGSLLPGQEQLLSLQYNQDATCFACGTTSGFRIFSCEPMREMIRRDFNERGIGIVAMLFRCNFLALVGGGDNPMYDRKKVMIWDDNQNRCIGELSFRSEVRAVVLRRDRIVVVLEHKVYVYNFADLKVLHQIETWGNARGLCCISQAPNNTVLVCPGTIRQNVRVELFDLKKSYFIRAHDNELACLALTMDGRRLATASTKGTLVRIFNTADGSQLQELRRGAVKADIYSIAFAPKTPHLAVSSDHGTVHVFALNCSMSDDDAAQGTPGTHGYGSNGSTPAAPAAATPTGSNVASSLSFMRVVLPKYFSSEWSIALYRIPEEVRSYAAFGTEVSVLHVVCGNGKFYKLRFDPKLGGSMKLEQVSDFLASEEGV